MARRYFPILTETACQLKWTWSTIRFYNGVASSCHRASISDIQPDNFDQFHNSSEVLAARQTMLDGKWPSGGCEYCQDIENAGGYSDRQLHLKIPNLVPDELDANPTALHVTPKILEIYLDNVCNMACLYCWDGFSSKIQQENIKFGTFDKDGVVIGNKTERHTQFDLMLEKFWPWLENNYTQLRRLHVLGGEPLYQPQFERCLEVLESHSNPELEFNIVTNLKVSESALIKFVERIKRLVIQKKIKRFDVTCSIDCFGDEQEYVRYGMNLDQWRKNFEYLVSQKWIKVNINQVLSNLTIKTVPQLLEYIAPLRKNQKIGHYFSTPVRTHEFLHPGIFGTGFFDKDFESILAVMPTNTWDEQEAAKYMQGIWLELNDKPRDQTKINQLSVFLDEIDRRRNLNWRHTFPWLEKEIHNVV